MNQEKPIVYVVDDASILKSLERLLRSAGYDVKTFPSALEFLRFEHQDTVSCLILDVMLPELDGLELQEQLTHGEIQFPVVFITGHGTIPMSVRAIKAGAVDFLQKPFSDKDLLSVIADAINKDRQLKVQQRELMKLRERLKSLTPREREVFALVVRGMRNKQIAFDLGTSEKTIKVHRARVMEKLEAQSLADLVRFAEKLSIHAPVG